MDLPPPPPVEMHQTVDQHAFVKQPNLAQYKGSDYAGALRVERGITLDEAFTIAEEDSQIDYFVYVKGAMMVLEVPMNVDFDPECDPLGLVTHTRYLNDDGEVCEGHCRIFTHGDVIFFRNEGRWLGTAPGLADVYEKRADVIDW